MPTLRTADAVAAWMEDLYLSELVLLSEKPAPRTVVGKRLNSVVLRVGLPDLEHTGARDRFLLFELTATEVVRWEADGPLDHDAELTVEVASDVSAPIALRLHAGGTALLACGQIVAEAREPVLRKARPRPWGHDFTMWSEDTTATVADLLRPLALDPEVALVSYDTVPLRAEPEWPLASLERRTPRAWRLLAGATVLAWLRFGFRHAPGFTLGLQRAAADDGLWDRLWALPRVLPVREVTSRTLRTDPAEWARVDWRRGAT